MCTHIYPCSHRDVHACLDLHAQVVTRVHVCAHVFEGAVVTN